MARRRLVERDRRDPMQLPILGLIGVDVVLALARAVDGGRHVERGRRLRLAIRLDRLDDAVRAGDAAEVARRRGIGAIGLVLREAHERLGVRAVVRRILEQRRAQRMTVSMAKAVGDLVHLGLDAVEVGQAEGMDLLGVGVDRRLGPDRQPIRGLAARCGAQAGLLASMRLVVLGEVVAQPAQTGVDVLLDRLGHAWTRVIRDARHSRGGIVRRRHGEQPIDLLERPPNGDRRRRSSVADTLGERLDVLLDQRRVAGIASQQLVESFG